MGLNGMLHVWLMFIITCSFIVPIWGSENNNDDKVIIHAGINSGTPKLHYVGQKTIDECKYYNMSIKANSPCFVKCEYRSSDSRVGHYINKYYLFANQLSVPQEEYNKACKKNESLFGVTEIFDQLSCNKSERAIPFACFVKEENNKLCFKQKGEILFSFTAEVCNKEIIFEVQLGTDFENKPPDDFIQMFKEEPLYALVSKPELLDVQIIVEEKDKIKHGSKGYFKEQKSLITNKIEEKQVASFFNFKNIFYILIPVICSYILYKLFMMRQI